MAKRTRPQGCCSIKSVRPLAKPHRRQLTTMLKALADPNRLEIMRVVVGQAGPVCACDIVDRFDLSQPTISHHLKTLCDAGLLISRRSGLWRFYSPDPAGIEKIANLGSLISKPA